jgi:hypothetical protein
MARKLTSKGRLRERGAASPVFALSTMYSTIDSKAKSSVDTYTAACQAECICGATSFRARSNGAAAN